MRNEQRRKAEDVLRAEHPAPDENEEQGEADARDYLRVHEGDVRERHDEAAQPPAHGLDAERRQRAEQRGEDGGAKRQEHAVPQQPHEVGVAEEVGVVAQGEALELAQVLPVVKGADKEYEHRRVEEEVDDDGPDAAKPFHIVATPSSPSSVKRFMSQMLMKTSTMSMRLMAAPRFWLMEPLNWSSMTSPIMVLFVPPSFCEM